MEITILNVTTTDPMELGIWAATNLLNARLPIPGPNHSLNISGELVPLLAELANRQSFATELYVVVVGATPTQSSIRRTGETTTKELSESMNKRKDILYRTIQTLEAVRETASRMITGMQQPRSAL